MTNLDALNLVLIVAKCIVNYDDGGINVIENKVLIVAKCIVNLFQVVFFQTK